MKRQELMWIFVCFAFSLFTADVWAYPVPDTGQTKCYNATVEIPCPSSGQPFYGQDAQYTINPMSYTKLDGSGIGYVMGMVKDNVTDELGNETPQRNLMNNGETKENYINEIRNIDQKASHYFRLNPLSITIIESRSIMSGHDMDQEWFTVVDSMGHIGTILPQETLDNQDFFSYTDILIISSGVIAIPDNRVNNIKKYVQQGGDVYLQSEYASQYPGNIAFETIVSALGGVFSWSGTVEGDLNPMNVLGILSTTPNNVPHLAYYWWGCAGHGDSTIENFLQYQDNYFGFIFTPTNSTYGNIITTSDKDWIHQRTTESPLLMKNIITFLDSALTNDGTCPSEGAINGSHGSVLAFYPLPTTYTELSQCLCGTYMGPPNHTGIDISTPGQYPDVFSVGMGKGTVIYNETKRNTNNFDDYWDAFVVIQYCDFYGYYGHIKSDLGGMDDRLFRHLRKVVPV